MIEREVKPEKRFQVIDHHRTWNKALIEQESQDILSEQVRGPHAQRWVGLTAFARVRRILFDLIHQAKQGLSLDVYLRRIVHLMCRLVNTGEEEVFEVL
jgi:hypothetical protein